MKILLIVDEQKFELPVHKVMFQFLEKVCLCVKGWPMFTNVLHCKSELINF